ncbi:galactokinase [Paludisphaera rhizosphaerae]|uniref:galactokinase n=1 Tax=Paludisphaera rhizosphaerae TaxID=2711216 RepID=UPI0013ECF72B|nr:galactokinase family protein [Paludisphaera rhizosphaerae]
MCDVDRFIESLRPTTAGGLFEPGLPIAVARAPGRLDVMGGIADYSGSLVLQMPIREAALAAVQTGGEGEGLLVVSEAAEPGDRRSVQMSRSDLDDLLAASYQEAREILTRDHASSWAAYLAGVLVVLAQEERARFDRGMRILLRSEVPEGKGVSSSAAIEVATMQAVARAIGLKLDGVRLATLCQRVENYVVGAPCGIMDQMASALGREHELLALLCQPAEVQGYVPISPMIGLWGIDSGVRHAVGGGDYGSVRTGAFMGYRIIADLAGLPVSEVDLSGVLRVEDHHWKGFLTNLKPSEFDARFRDRLPETMSGAEFLASHRGLTDPVTRIDPSRTYAVRKPTSHPVYENDRVRRFGELVEEAHAEDALREMGVLMYLSHDSYSSCGLGSDGTDRLVAMVRQAGPEWGLYGAKITGGGSGGTVAILGWSNAGDAVQEIADRYARETGRTAYVFEGSSPGACQFGTRVHTLD